MTKSFSFVVLSILLLASLCFGQTATTNTTLSIAMGRSDTTLTLVSSTGVSASNGTAPVTGLYIDREYMEVVANVNSAGTGNNWQIRRGVAGIQSPHPAGAIVWVSVPGTFDKGPYDRVGTCTATSFAFLPIIQVQSGNLLRCVGGKWVTGNIPLNNAQPYTAFTTFSGANPIATTSVTDVNGTIWFSQISIPYNATLSGACVLNGATVGTDKWIVALYDSTGALVASSPVAGTTTATASKYQCIAFTVPSGSIPVAGPQTYFVALQGNGTTDNFQAYATGGAPTNYGTQSQTGTFGTLAAMTTPTTTFTTAKGPLMYVY